MAEKTPKTTFTEAVGNQKCEKSEILGCCQRRWQHVPAADNEKKSLVATPGKPANMLPPHPDYSSEAYLTDDDSETIVAVCDVFGSRPSAPSPPTTMVISLICNDPPLFRARRA